MKILLAGQNGIIGSYLFNELKSHYHLFGIGKGAHISNNYCDLDLTDIKRVENFINQQIHFDVLIFLVGLAHDKGRNQDYPVFEKINFITLINLLESMKKLDKVPAKIIFSSTISVYGEKMDRDFYCEEDILNPNSPYAKTKILAENYLNKTFSNKSWILRFAPVYSEKFKLNITRRTTIKGKNYKVGKGENKLSLLNIKNIYYAVNQILEGKLPSGTYNIADQKIYTFNDLLNYTNIKTQITIPKIIPKTAYTLGKLLNNIFLQENSIKLLTDNIYSTTKLEKYIKLPYSLSD
ncbi:MAG: NAD(P)-dependent oxidoreductase [Ignavibacteriae bacterium]|nr:NAD(P)-dependent oxidoreductase [Ignavibacteriota bacterium]